MRIVGGSLRGRVLSEFKDKGVRPTSDMARESLFNILRFKVVDCAFLDLFAGTGAVGIEAFSRGAKTVWLNDLTNDSIALITKNLEKLGIKNDITLTKQNALILLQTISEKFDIIYLDPPYKLDIKVQALSLAKNALTKDGIVVLEDEQFLEEKIDGLVEYDRRKYGRVHLTFLKLEN